uniref:GRIP and coiled-coil domain containing 2 n=1 Tax=Neolamprologus brichardi TaxID=32507 RepID=A0A3Q4MAL5_NEOBR
IEEHQKKIKALESSIEECTSKHQEEVSHFQKLLKEREERDRERESERERERQADLASAKESAEEVRCCLEAQLETLRAELQTMQERNSQEVLEIQENHQKELTLFQLNQNITVIFPESYLQDVQEEDEEAARGSGIAKMLELSGCSQGDSSHGDGEETETGRLKATLDDVQAQNTMLQDEMTLLSNVKGELEAELERVKEEFQMEREELEFKINELQMLKDSASAEASMTQDPDHQGVLREAEESVTILAKEQNSQSPEEEQQKLNQELRTKCEALTKEQDSAQAECHHMRGILQSFETELGEKTNDFIVQYKAMKEQAANNIRDLNEKVEQLSKERDELLEKVREATDEKNALMGDMQDLKLKLESSQGEEQMSSAYEIISQLEIKENMTQDLNERVETLTEERDKMQHLLKIKEEEMQKLNNERTKEIERLQEEKEREVLLLREEKETELKSLKTETEDKVKRLKEEREKLEGSLKEEFVRSEQTASTLELTIKELYTEKSDLQQKMEEALSRLSKAQEERELLDSKLAALEAQLNQETSEKQEQEARLNSMKTEAERISGFLGVMEENLGEELQESMKEVKDLQARVDELEKERALLRSSLEEAQGGRTFEEVQTELKAHIKDLEQERNMLRTNIEEVVKDTEGLQKDLQDMKAVNEKIIEENEKLQAQISLMTKEEEEREEIVRKVEIMEKESRELKEQLTEKDSLISQLRTEMASIQVSGARDVITLKEEVESLKAEREKVNSSMKDIIHGAEGYKNLQIDYDKQTEQLDKEREKVEAAERQIAELTKRLSSSFFFCFQSETLSSEKEDLLAGMETMRSTLKQLETKNQEMQRQSASLERDLLAERAIKEQKIKDLSSAMKEAEELTAQLRKQQQQSQQTAQELEQLRKEAQQSSLLDMEMADYERLVKELNTKLSEKDECVEELKGQINSLNQKEEVLKQEIESLKSQLDQGEEKNAKIKQLLVKTKKDLADAKKQESSLMVLQASLKGELEANQQQLESSKIEVCDLTAERHRLQEQLKSALEQQQRTSSSLQQRIQSLQQERDTAKVELEATTKEFESYKVRVHNVLKQQKNKTTQNEVDSGKLEREQLVSQVEQLRTRLVESQQSLQSSAAELQQLQTEHDTLLERHNKILQETVSKEAELRERLLSLQSENVTLRSDLSQAQADLSSQVEAQRQTYREQLRKLQDDHRATVETLQGQLTRVEEQLFTLQSQNSKHGDSVAVQSSRKPLASDPQRRNTDQNQAGVGPVALSDLQSMAREEGEGMETTETESFSPAPTSLPSLEQLLTSPEPKQEPFVWTVEPTKEELSEKLNTATRSMEHMNSLLHETEATNAILMEQITLLKSEVRRLERNQEREKSVANLEYLKNVLLQFIFLRSGSERQALLPVIHTMLQLSPEEKSKLSAIAQGEEEASGSRSSGWTSYLHSWSGIR